MGNGIGAVLLSGLISYPVFIGAILAAIISMVLLVSKRKTMKASTRVLLIVLFIVALAIVLLLSIMAGAFGNTHPEAPPVPVS